MRSATVEVPARARIRDAALAQFAVQGEAATVRSVAAGAGVSPALVIHHFGSKQGLREACDAYVIGMVEDVWARVAAGGPEAAGGVEELARMGAPLLRYFGRVVLDGGPRADALVDRFVTMTEQMLAGMQAQGWVRPTADPRARAVLLVLLRLAGLLLAGHVERAIGSSPLTAEGAARLGRASLDLMTHGLFTDDRWARAMQRARPEEGS